jgi:hypothetical protein
MKITFDQIKYHRNGVGGAPFHVVLFRDASEGVMLGVVFEEKHHVAVLNLERLSSSDIGYGTNSWRGDVYEPHLRNAIKSLEAERMPPCP